MVLKMLFSQLSLICWGREFSGLSYEILGWKKQCWKLYTFRLGQFARLLGCTLFRCCFSCKILLFQSSQTDSCYLFIPKWNTFWAMTITCLFVGLFCFIFSLFPLVRIRESVSTLKTQTRVAFSWYNLYLTEIYWSWNSYCLIKQKQLKVVWKCYYGNREKRISPKCPVCWVHLFSRVQRIPLARGMSCAHHIVSQGPRLVRCLHSPRGPVPSSSAGHL